MKKSKMLQFGEGNFLRGFVDEMVDKANLTGFMNTDIYILKPRRGPVATAFKKQDCKYTVCLRDKAGANIREIGSVKDIMSCYDDYERFMSFADDIDLKYIVSNTTEAGIVYLENDTPKEGPCESFPGKLADFLLKRYSIFAGKDEGGLIILPTELIDENGKALKDCVLRYAEKRNADDGFYSWLNKKCCFCSTLVDRIISGYPKSEAEKLWEEWGYRDELIVTGETFGLWVISSERDIRNELPLERAGLPVVFADDIGPYKRRKVRILNGAHTSFSLIAYLAGFDTVYDAVSDPSVSAYLDGLINEEIIPTLEMPKDELVSFAEDVRKRFANPFIRHELYSIALNSVSKWRTRCLPTLLDRFSMTGTVPERLAFSFAALLAFYKGKETSDGTYAGERMINGNACGYVIRDDERVLSVFKEASKKNTEEYADAVIGCEILWGKELKEMKGFKETVVRHLNNIMASPSDALLSKGSLNRG